MYRPRPWGYRAENRWLLVDRRERPAELVLLDVDDPHIPQHQIWLSVSTVDGPLPHGTWYP